MKLQFNLKKDEIENVSNKRYLHSRDLVLSNKYLEVIKHSLQLEKYNEKVKFFFMN